MRAHAAVAGALVLLAAGCGPRAGAPAGEGPRNEAPVAPRIETREPKSPGDEAEEGPLHGTVTTYHANGNKQEESEYVNGELHGMSRMWDESGKPFSERRYEHGTLVSDRAFEGGAWVDKPIPRNLCSIQMAFFPGTHVRAQLFVVRSGSAERASTHGMRKSPNELSAGGEAEPEPREVTLQVEEKAEDGMTIYTLKSRGASRGGSGSTLKKYPPVPRTHARSLFGGDLRKVLPKGTARLIYVEGDAEFRATPETTPAEFAAANPGNFLLVTIEWSEE